MMVNKFLEIDGINVGEFFGEMGFNRLVECRGIDQARRRIMADKCIFS